MDRPVVPNADTVSKNRLRNSTSSVKVSAKGYHEDEGHTQGRYRKSPMDLEVGYLPPKRFGL